MDDRPDPSALKDVHQRLIAILTAHLAGDTPTEFSLAKEILEDNMLLVQSFGAFQRLTYELIHFLAKERGTSPEEILREIGLAVADRDDEGGPTRPETPDS
jgi:hypothetical protein